MNRLIIIENISNILPILNDSIVTEIYMDIHVLLKDAYKESNHSNKIQYIIENITNVDITDVDLAKIYNTINNSCEQDKKIQIIQNECHIVNVTNNITINNSKSYNTSRSYHFIYILHISMFRDRNELTYKYGRTSNVYKRFAGYPKNSTLLYLRRVRDCIFVENEIKIHFHKHYNHKEKYGHEYFSGDVNKMINDINVLIESKNQELELKNDILDNIKYVWRNRLYFDINNENQNINMVYNDIIINDKDYIKPKSKNIQNVGTKTAIKKSVMTTSYRYKCDDCDKGFHSKQNLTYHINNNVCLKKEYICKYCPGKFASKNTMYTHMREVCKIKKQNDNEKENILDRLMKIEEENKKQKEVTQKLTEDNIKLKEENEKMKLRMKRVTKTKDKLPNINNINSTNNTNSTNSINNTIIRKCQ
jgi:hypothetical protein